MGNERGERFVTKVLAVTWVAILAGMQAATSFTAQSPAGQAPVEVTPQWQIDAGGKIEFDIASVKKDVTPPSAQTVSTNIPLGPMDMFSPTGGLLASKNYSLITYLMFAYKLSSYQIQVLFPLLPKWANADRYDIEARAPIPNPSKDQFRLMMQALLADRFKLATHYETRQVPVLALVLDKPGKLGPQLRPHQDDVPCTTAVPPPGQTTPVTIAGGFPDTCSALRTWFVAGRIHTGSRNMSLAVLANQLTGLENGIDRPILDKTGLAGKYDFVFEYKPQVDGPIPAGSDFQPDESAPTFLEALKQQLGLKLESQTGPVPVIVVDHVEQPSDN